jgi:hypothetical protein
LQLQIANRDQLHRSLQKNISAEIVTCCWSREATSIEILTRVAQRLTLALDNTPDVHTRLIFEFSHRLFVLLSSHFLHNSHKPTVR